MLYNNPKLPLGCRLINSAHRQRRQPMYRVSGSYSWSVEGKHPDLCVLTSFALPGIRRPCVALPDGVQLGGSVIFRRRAEPDVQRFDQGLGSRCDRPSRIAGRMIPRERSDTGVREGTLDGVNHGIERHLVPR